MTDDRPDKPELATEQIMLIRQGVEGSLASLDLDLTASDARS
jgi:hypothetical protein